MGGSMSNSMKQCYDIQRTWPVPGKAPYIVDKVGSVMYEEEFAALEKTIKDWASTRLTGAQAWAAIRKDVLRNQKPATIGLESMVRASGNTTKCGSKEAEGFEGPMFGAGIVAVESQAMFEFFENLLVGVGDRQHQEGFNNFDGAWIQAMKGLGVKVAKPDDAAIRSYFKMCVMEAMDIECKTFGWLKLVKACVCLEVARYVKAPINGLPASALQEPPETPTLLETPSLDGGSHSIPLLKV